ncbi:DMT family transporter [Beggiatoa leptomitoformis]|uniref:EamA-like transporter family protein n=1 Tax=Beggiatoa leptomitoformis TaxID=288004 RepID=A0A2N9YGX6_9GAMM|nr:DMT family transporter [Beggiatoa leptomitoformis]ALG67976.1 EamA-like transporter family protein [Beggiatoa leptomitoformis]AUI69744.1 EamA-like transporter family protein [Beggiatoa leptomitoformis]
MNWLLALLTLIGGMALPLQAGVNATLSRYLGSPALAALMSFLVGTLALLAYYLLTRQELPTFTTLKNIPYWVWIGGVLGAFYVLIAVTVAHKLGSATLIALTVTGQMLASLTLDHYGLVGFVETSLSAGRIAGAILLIAGVVLIKIF